MLRISLVGFWLEPGHFFQYFLIEVFDVVVQRVFEKHIVLFQFLPSVWLLLIAEYQSSYKNAVIWKQVSLDDF